MIYMWFIGINYYKLAVEKDRDSIFTTITSIWKPGIRIKKRLKQITKRNIDGSILSLSVSESLPASNPGNASIVGVVLPFMYASSSLW
jgi:hypothetical protein